ncbi:MAG: hypothetical protein HY887_05265 [Deltaproteobacteria bacterium]|nr:hypothetical protein [Deltaproteobacteria bacterium]
MIGIIIVFIGAFILYWIWVRPRNKRIEREIMNEVNLKERMENINTGEDLLKEIFRKK